MSLREKSIRVFYLKIIILCFIFFGILITLDILSMKSDFGYDIMTKLTGSGEYVHLGTSEINPYIAKVRETDSTTGLILGDSVAHQIFNGGGDDLQQYNPDITIIGSNGAITMAGQYMLAKEYLEHHEDATDVYLVVLPESLGRNFEPTYGFQYAVMPFVQNGCLDALDENTKQEIKEAYGPFALNRSFVEIIDRSAVNEKLFLNYLVSIRRPYSSPSRMHLADQYIMKLYELCEQRQVNLHLYPCPMDEAKTESYDKMNAEYRKSPIYQLFPDYMEQVVFCPDEQFSDGTHFTGAYNTRQNFNEMICDIYADTDLPQILNLSMK